MSKKRGVLSDKVFGLLIVMAVLQAAAVGLLLRYGGEILDKNSSIREHTSAMMNEIFPAMRNDLVDVSQKTSEIKSDVTGLRSQVSRVDERLNEVNRGVNAVGLQVDGLDRNVQGFVQDKSGLIWGHSLNPYVLIGLFALIAASVPWWGWYFVRNVPTSSVVRKAGEAGDDFSDKLDRLSRMVEKIRDEDGRYSETPQLQQLMEKTERLIDEARVELASLSEKVKCCREDGGGPDILH